MKIKMCEQRFEEIRKIIKQDVNFLSTLNIRERDDFTDIMRLRDIVINSNELSIYEDEIFEGSRLIYGYYGDFYFRISNSKANANDWTLNDCNELMSDDEVETVIAIFERGYDKLRDTVITIEQIQELSEEKCKEKAKIMKNPKVIYVATVIDIDDDRMITSISTPRLEILGKVLD